MRDSEPHRSEQKAKPWLVAGKVVRAHGIRGELGLSIFFDAPFVELGLREVELCIPSGKRERFKIETCRQANKLVLLRCVGISDRNTAEFWRGASVAVDPEQFDDQAEEDFLQAWLGLDVVDETKKCWGKVESFFDNGAHPVMVIRGEGAEYLLPVLEHTVISADIPKNQIVIRPIDGLFE